MGGGERGGRKGREEGKMDGDKTKRVGMREGEGEGGERWRGGEKGGRKGRSVNKHTTRCACWQTAFPAGQAIPQLYSLTRAGNTTQQFSGRTRACVCERVNSKTTPPFLSIPFLRTSIYICRPTTTELPP